MPTTNSTPSANDGSPGAASTDGPGGCRCARIMVGMSVTEQRNWNPDCAEHGTSSDWYRSSEQVAARAAQRDRLVDLQRRARDARRGRGSPTGQ